MEDKDVYKGINWVLQNGYVKGKTFGGSYDITKQIGYLYFIRTIRGQDKIPLMVMTEIRWNGTNPKRYTLTNTPLTEEEIKDLKGENKELENENNKLDKMKDGGNIVYRVGKYGKPQRMVLKLLLDSLNTKITQEEKNKGILGYNINGIPVYSNQDPVYTVKQTFSSAGDKGLNYTLTQEESPNGFRYILEEGGNKKIFTDPKEFPYGELPFLQEGNKIDPKGLTENKNKIVDAFSLNTKASLTSNENLVLNTLNIYNTLNTTPNNTEFLKVEQNAGLLNTQNATQRRLLMLAQDEINNANRLGLKQMNSNVPSMSDYNNSILKLQNLFNNARQIKQDVKNNAVNAFTNLGNTLINTAGKFIGGGIEAGFKYKNSKSVASNSKGNKLSYKIIF